MVTRLNTSIMTTFSFTLHDKVLPGTLVNEAILS